MSFLTPDKLVKELYLKPGSHVADIGSGSGAYTIALSDAVTSVGQVYAVDINRESLHSLANVLEKNNIVNVDVVWANVEQDIPIESYSLDAVILSNVLFQLEDKNKSLKNITKILKPDGQLLIVDWSGSHSGIGPHPSHVITEEDAEELIKKHGFRIEKRLPAGRYHYAFMAVGS